MYVIRIFSVCKHDSLSSGLKLLRFITILKVTFVYSTRVIPAADIQILLCRYWIVCHSLQKKKN